MDKLSLIVLSARISAHLLPVPRIRALWTLARQSHIPAVHATEIAGLFATSSASRTSIVPRFRPLGS